MKEARSRLQEIRKDRGDGRFGDGKGNGKTRKDWSSCVSKASGKHALIVGCTAIGLEIGNAPCQVLVWDARALLHQRRKQNKWQSWPFHPL